MGPHGNLVLKSMWYLSERHDLSMFWRNDRIPVGDRRNEAKESDRKLGFCRSADKTMRFRWKRKVVSSHTRVPQSKEHGNTEQWYLSLAETTT